ncbi:murein L,D-transpeptidase catalytic domain family protein [Cetobacterium somerae]|uniref:murein L,D-transpeptidase catalytic domain family protein n=1 Tax=Cetobacterium TaxID=180162 RepID=UPI001F061235|nr:murein L,D-transpeptidase catalytic domain family protein [Cetobacterium somerae]MCX3066008.1 murein L,D-transpeptidase catalytic domain family protein [Cetobacterium somerae]UPO96467.1 murein L,D-transpeptidase catalytic domain family protein [Cetobacterium somerae]
MIKNILVILFTLASSTMASMGNYSINEKLNLDSSLSIENIKVRSSNKFAFLPNSSVENLYKELNLTNKMDFTTFSNAISGMKKLKDVKEDIITIIDFTKSSIKERFFVIDLKNKKTLFSTYVMHGKNSGESIPKEFSNAVNSFKSSPGFYKTENTYNGEYGYSLRLNGLEKGINDKARERAIVVHGSQYAKPKPGAKKLDRSLGCPAIPKEISDKVINKIKDGRLLYIHTNEKSYVQKSSII